MTDCAGVDYGFVDLGGSDVRNADSAASAIELTILMPCLNEEATIAACIAEARSYLDNCGAAGEILIADNGSTDNSKMIAAEMKARVVVCRNRGYGNALRAGLSAARGRYIIMGDCDMSYDFLGIEAMHRLLREGYDVVIGNRLAVMPPREAMSLTHWMGVHFLSWAARRRFGCQVTDFHCGLRGISSEAAHSLRLRTEGMEFATELIAEASRSGLRIAQTPVVLRPDGRDGPSHLRTVRDGFRHLAYIVRNETDNGDCADSYK